MFKRVLALLVAVIMLLALATACKPKTSATTSPSSTAAATTVKPSGSAAATTPKPSTSASATVAPSATAPSDIPINEQTVDPNQTEAPKVTVEPPPAETINPSVEPTTPPDYVRPAEANIDLGGRSVVFKGHYLTLNQYKVTPTGDPTNGADITYAAIQNVQNKFNFVFDFQPIISSGWRVIDAFNMQASAGTDWADIVWNMSRMAFPVQAVRNLVVPLDTIFDFQNDPVYNARYLRTCAEWEGRVYGLGAGPVMSPDLGMFYNVDIIQAMGLPDPIDLYNQGNWTWDNFFDLAIQATRDFDNDGNIDQWGINGDVRRVYMGLLTSNGCDIVDYIDGQYSLALEKPAAMKAFMKINDIFNTLKIVRPDTFLLSDQDPSFGAGKALFLMAGLPGHIVSMRNAAVKNVRWMSLPRGPNNPTGNLNMIRESNYFAWTTTIGDDWKEVVTATSWLFCRGYDYIRYPAIDKSKIWDRAGYISSQLPQGYYDAKDLEHMASLIYDQGTVVIKWPAWATITDIVTNKILTEICQGVPVITAVDMHRDECIAEMNATLNYWQ